MLTRQGKVLMYSSFPSNHSIMHNHPSLIETFFIHSMLFSHHPPILFVAFLSTFPNTSHIESYYSRLQPVLLHSLHVSKPPQHTLLCSTSQLSHNISSPLHVLIPRSVHTCYSTHTSQTPHLHYF